ncbi:PPP4R2-domain-containing protein [Dichomitus squalens LYAD-421 SS1]|nr:PPP4R2-domain-containing protein [Dichomitus squalens LYAD-421 SS1]EJF65910.1 PPP4R2-domain-containing protein [Dichomitus squalens LYAD-421 SS1]TBU65769.1 PPP4R2-domain-containing protein [Dichomitus squalens]
MTTTPEQLQNGGLKLPPFPPREYPAGISNPPPKVDLSENEAQDLKTNIYAQLDEFDGYEEYSTPFTIQRLCELCVDPRKHYKYIGKYLRAVEKTLLITSTWDSFPPLSEIDSTYSPVGHSSISTSTVSAPNTPMFSPIPFLHEDARRSKSRSPPPSPLVLPATIAGGLSGADESADVKALGLVDELDDPSPGHLSDHIEPISSTTTVDSRPLHGTLEERFVKASEGASAGEGEPSGDVPMAQDEDEGKENRAV